VDEVNREDKDKDEALEVDTFQGQDEMQG